MRRPFSALLWKESLEVSRHALPLLALFAVMFFLSLAGQESISSDPDPARHFTWYWLLTAFAATMVGFWQTYRERRTDMWTFALHRNASSTQVMGAKLVAGVAAMVVAMAVPYAIAMWWLSVPGHRAIPFDRTYALAGIADFFAALTYYAGGLYAGSRRERPLTRGIGTALAFLGTGISFFSQSFAVAIAVSIALTVVLTAAAWSDFIGGSEFDAQPLWGRAANVLSAVPALALVLAFAVAIAATLLPTGQPESAPPRTGPQALVTTTGRIILVPAGNDGRAGDGVIMAQDLATDPGTIPSTINLRFREPRRWVTPLFFELENPLWYYERREGLISIYDARSRAIRGWLGPDGYSEGAAKPARRFAGYLQTERITNNVRTGLLVFSGAVYEINELAAPKLVFTAPEGETILQAKGGAQYGGMAPRPDAPWGWFTAVTTTKRTYVLDRKSGAVQISVPHTGANAQRNVSVYRAPYASGATTFLWYHPAKGNRADTTNHVLEFRQGSATAVAEHWVEARPYSPIVRESAWSPPPGLSVPLSAVPAVVPAAHFYPMEGTTLRRVSLALLISVLSAGFALWLCRRHAFSQGRTITWTALSALIGPIALAVMWLLLEWPAKEVVILSSHQEAV